jgi:hypothetical protein
MNMPLTNLPVSDPDFSHFKVTPVTPAIGAVIEDGENYMLTMRLGLLCQQLYAEGWTQN